jgi:uncharacterized protein YhfF
MPTTGSLIARAVRVEIHGMAGEGEMRKAEFAFPGELRDRLVEAILDGRKTSTSSLLLEYELESEPLPEPGERSVVVDSAGRAVAVIETTAVEVVAAAAIDLAFARDEGEGFETVAAWRAAHERFWQSPEMRAALGDPGFRVTDETLVIAERFRLVERLR